MDYSSKRYSLIAVAHARAIPMEPRYRLCRDLEALAGAEPDRDLAERHGTKVAFIRQARQVLEQPRSGQTLAAEAESRGVRLVTALDPEYPGALRELELPPPCLFCRTSTLDALGIPGIGIVGPRNADAYGLEAARLFARDLSTAGLAITSGFARGVDAAAHEEAARTGNPTIAVLGCGVDIPYPRQNQRLLQPILAAGGIVLSEFPLGTPPAAWRFPVRNRLIAALTIGMLVVQASQRSGSLISARLALEQGREVYAVPGRIFDARSRGTNALLKDGAHVAVDAQCVLDTLPTHLQDELLRQRLGADRALRRAALDAKLKRQPCSAESLAEDLGLRLSQVLEELTDLELDGKVDRLAGGIYRPSNASDA